MRKEVYIPATKSLFTASTATNVKTSEVIKLTNDHKMIYFWCKDQYDFFKSRSSKFFASWEDIIKNLGGMTYERKIKRVVKDLQTLGLIEVVGSKKSNHKVVHRVDSMTDWELSNPEIENYKKPEAVQERKEAKEERLNKWAEKKNEEYNAKTSTETKNNPTRTNTNTTVSSGFNSGLPTSPFNEVSLPTNNVTGAPVCFFCGCIESPNGCVNPECGLDEFDGIPF